MTARSQPPPHGAFHPIKTPRTSEMAARQIADLILRRELPPGGRLPSEAELARQMGISRLSLREAMRFLESWGMVEVRRGRGQGVFARMPGVDDMTRSVALVLDSQGSTLADITHARIAIESACIRLAAERHDEAKLTALLSMVEGVQPGSSDWLEHTVAFHTAIASAAGNAVLETVVASLGGLIRFSASEEAGSLESRAATLVAHRKIAEALLAGDVATAERRLTRHMVAYLELVETRYRMDFALLTGKIPALSGRPPP